MIIDRLNQVNDVPVYSVHEKIFESFGRIVTGYDVSSLITFMEHQTTIPESGNVYIASVPELEQQEVTEQMKMSLCGGMEIQIGYCNGKNSTYNGFEYHKSSEINVAVTDFMLVLGHTWDIKDNTYDGNHATVFFVPKGSIIEMYQTTLHLSPCKISEQGFRDIVILPKGTNTPLSSKMKAVEKEGALLLQRNKWVLAHPNREPLIRQGAHPGVLGENKELKY